MALALDYNFSYTEKKREQKIIDFSSSAIRVIINIPNALLTFLLSPFVLMLIPIIHITLWNFLRNIKKKAATLQKNYLHLSYEQTKEGYYLLSELITISENIYKELKPRATNYFTQIMVSYFQDITDIHKEMKELLASTLYLKMEHQEPLSEKEKEELEALNDIWGDDQDEVYARHTHSHLINKAQ